MDSDRKNLIMWLQTHPWCLFSRTSPQCDTPGWSDSKSRSVSVLRILSRYRRYQKVMRSLVKNASLTIHDCLVAPKFKYLILKCCCRMQILNIVLYSYERIQIVLSTSWRAFYSQWSDDTLSKSLWRHTGKASDRLFSPKERIVFYKVIQRFGIASGDFCKQPAQ